MSDRWWSLVGGARIRRSLRFGAVSVINVPLVQVVILLLQLVGGLEGWLANLLAVAILTGPVYLVSKWFVWGRRGDIGAAPAVWFWGLSIGGLVASTAAVYALSRFIEGLWVANVANLAVYGTIFVVRFLVLDRALGRTP